MRKIKLCFFDNVGLYYNGNSISEKGVGGSESAIIYMSKELSKIGFDVTVYCPCDMEGFYDGVRYIDVSKRMQNKEYYDVMISQRSILAFAPEEEKGFIIENYGQNGWDIFNNSIKDKSFYKMVWVHDIECVGHNHISHFISRGYLNEVILLSDFHATFLINGYDTIKDRLKINEEKNIEEFELEKRYSTQIEMVKNSIFMTRNGVNIFNYDVDIFNKDENLFVWNASLAKGANNLLYNIWPEIKKRIPKACLKIIGGYYIFAAEEENDGLYKNAFQKEYDKLKSKFDGKMDIEFLGIIKQEEISKILEKAKFFIYPANSVPETFGISTLEAISYNTIPLVNNFGALEQVADSDVSFSLYNYKELTPKESNESFVDMVEYAYNSNYLCYVKSNACNAYKKWIGWDSIAIQWKKHFSDKIGMYFSLEEEKKFVEITRNISSLFESRFLNKEDRILGYEKTEEERFVFIVPYRNAEKYIQKNILSIAFQNYNNYSVILIDDLSTDNSLDIVNNTLKELPIEISEKFNVVKNSERKGALRNQVENIQKLTKEDDVIVLLDGDDWLVSRSDVIDVLNYEYRNGAEMTYGSFFSIADGINVVAEVYPEYILRSRNFVDYNFMWNVPITHLRTFRRSLFDKVNLENLRDGGVYFDPAGDLALQYELLYSLSDVKNLRPIFKVICVYNDLNPNNDYKIKDDEQKENVKKIKKIRYENYTRKEIKKNEIVDMVRKKDKNAIVEYKDIISNNEISWIDDVKNVLDVSMRIEFVKKTIKDVLGENRDLSILDIGSFTGAFSNEIFIDGYNDITCMDISKLNVDRGKSEFPNIKWILSDIEEYAFDKKYDVIIMCEILEHLINPEKVIEKARNALTDRGIIIYTIPSENFVFEYNQSEHVSKLEKPFLQKISYFVEEVFSKSSERKYSWYYGFVKKNTKILIAVPTAKYVECPTFKSIYYLNKPDGVDLNLQFFFGYRVDQVRNLIVDEAIKNGYDKIFFVDSDIILPENSLEELLKYDKKIISGVYLQREMSEFIPELFNESGRVTYEDLVSMDQQGINKVFACGFGCVLVDVSVFKDIGYPYFVYHSSIDFRETISEDYDFCVKVNEKGYGVYVLPKVKCGHISTFVINV